MKGGIGWNLRISGVERYLYDIYLMFLSWEIDIKLCQSYTKIKSCIIKQIIFNNYATNLKTTISHCHWLKFWWCDAGYTDYMKWYYQLYLLKMQNKKYKRNKPDILRLLWNIDVFRLVAYLLNKICLILQILYKIAYIWIFV